MPATNAIVPAGLVSVRVHQLGGGNDDAEALMEEMLKKQKCGGNNKNARLAGTTSGSPRRAQ